MDNGLDRASDRAGRNRGAAMRAQDTAAGVTMQARPWWISRTCIALLVFAATVPLLYPPVPPLVDLLGHMGRFRVELDAGHSPWLQQYYTYHWAPIGNLGVDI